MNLRFGGLGVGPLVTSLLLLGCSMAEPATGSRSSAGPRGTVNNPAAGAPLAGGQSSPPMAAPSSLVMRDPAVSASGGKKVCASAVVQSSKVPPTVAINQP